MAKTVKKLSAMTTVNAVNDNQKIPLTDANGKVTLISLADLKKSLLGGMNLDQMNEGVFIMFHRNSDDYPLMVCPRQWPSYQNSGEIAEGVVIVDGGKVLVVAPTEGVSLKWSSAAVDGGGTSTSDRVTAYNDWNGKTNTAAAIKASQPETVTNTKDFAPGFCNLYSRVNANGKGLTAGKWWLPSLGELFMIYAHYDKINYALSLITGAAKLVDDWYWSSTENSAQYAWFLLFSYGYTSAWHAKSDLQLRVRPVSAFIL